MWKKYISVPLDFEALIKYIYIYGNHQISCASQNCFNIVHKSFTLIAFSISNISIVYSENMNDVMYQTKRKNASSNQGRNC